MTLLVARLQPEPVLAAGTDYHVCRMRSHLPDSLGDCYFSTAVLALCRAVGIDRRPDLVVDALHGITAIAHPTIDEVPAGSTNGAIPCAIASA